MNEAIKAAIDLANESYQEGLRQGWDTGYKAGVEAAKLIIGGMEPDAAAAKASELFPRVGSSATTPP